MRRLVEIGLALAAAAFAAGLVLGSAEAPRDLLPDIDQAVPRAVAVRRHDGRELLAFASSFDNVGDGPLVVEAAREDRSTRTMSARQRVRRADGSERRERIPVPVRYERAETHAHWHLIGFERYELRTSDGQVAVPARKAGFCLGDRYESRRSVRLPGEPTKAVWTEECGKGRPGLLAFAQGLSVGYGDDYAPLLEGQFVDVTDLPAGRYVLVHLANPERVLRESEYGNNAASVALDLGRPRGAGAAPTVEILARCPDGTRCAP